VEKATTDGKRERWWGKRTLGKDKRDAYNILHNTI
jgi:hypothetical protein